MNRLLLELIDEIIKDLRHPRTDHQLETERFLFAGLTVVLAGDFRQLLTVVKGAVQATPEAHVATESKRRVPRDLVNHLLFSSDIWRENGKVRRLTQQMRQAEDSEFANLMRELGRGNYSTNDQSLPL